MSTEPGHDKVYTIRSSTPRVRELPLRERPREVFAKFGAEHVSDTILLALILRSGTTGLNVLELARDLLREYGTLTELSRIPVEEFAGRRGIGRVKAQVLKASLELARRLAEENMSERPAICTPEDAAAVLRERVRSKDTESFWTLLLDARNRMNRLPVEVSRGVLDASLVHPREVFREAIRSSSAAVVLVHNHPSGDPSPSAEDLRITRQLVNAGKILNIGVLDHVIIGQRTAGRGEDFFSMREAGVVPFED